jgi:hypothetical protein
MAGRMVESLVINIAQQVRAQQGARRFARDRRPGGHAARPIDPCAACGGACARAAGPQGTRRPAPRRSTRGGASSPPSASSARPTHPPPPPHPRARLLQAVEAKEAGAAEVAKLLQQPEDLERLPALRAEYDQRHKGHKQQLSATIQSQVENARFGLELLDKSHRNIAKLRTCLDKIEQ